MKLLKRMASLVMAAGLSSRFAPISYERPKGVLKVRGEVLIERQIRQLLEAGIDDITVVVGYKKEEFFYLEDLFGVKVVVNDRTLVEGVDYQLEYANNVKAGKSAQAIVRGLGSFTTARIMALSACCRRVL